MSHQITWETEGIYAKFSGVVTVEEIDRMTCEALADTRFIGMHYWISDFLEVRECRVSRYEALVIAAHNHNQIKPANPGIKVAIVGKDEKVMEAASAYAQSPLMSDFKVQLFDSLAEAWLWVRRR